MYKFLAGLITGVLLVIGGGWIAGFRRPPIERPVTPEEVAKLERLCHERAGEILPGDKLRGCIDGAVWGTQSLPRPRPSPPDAMLAIELAAAASDRALAEDRARRASFKKK